jgi:site-specific DNA-methyltransferase (adenine-specific)
LKITEDIVIFSNQVVKYNPQLTYGYKDRTKENPNIKKSDLFSGIKSGKFFKTDKNKPAGSKYPKNIIDISKQATECCNSKSIHPTQKPISLIEYLIKTYTNKGDLILDNCAGSFTTAIAADNLKRNWICIEKEQNYVDLGTKRVNVNRASLGLAPLIAGISFSSV